MRKKELEGFSPEIDLTENQTLASSLEAPMLISYVNYFKIEIVAWISQRQYVDQQ